MNSIKKITYKEIKENYDQYVFISIYTDIEDVIQGTAFYSEEDIYIEKAIAEHKKIIFYGIDKYDICHYKYIYETYGKYIGYDNIYFYENGLKEWLTFYRIYGNKEFPIYRYV